MITAIWINQKIGVNELQNLNDESIFNNKELMIDRNILVDMLGIQSSLKTKMIVSDSIRVVGPAKPGQENSQLFLNAETIQLNASSFDGDDKPYEFQLAREVVNLEVANAIKNVKLMSAKHSFKSGTHSSKGVKYSGNLGIISNEELELSGNLGLKAHGQAIRSESAKDISIISKDESITISANKGLYLNIMHMEDFNEKYDEDQNRVSRLLEQSSKTHLCISQTDGMVISGSCE